MDNRVIKKFLGQEVTVVILKSYVFICTDIKISDNFIVVENKHSITKLNPSAICYVDFNKTTGANKISYKSSEMVSGILKDIDHKFIEVEITNQHNNNIYHVIIPLKSIEGIKIFDEDKE